MGRPRYTEAGFSRRSFLKFAATAAVMAGVLPGTARAQDRLAGSEQALTGEAVETMATHLAGIPVSPEEAAGYAPGVQNFATLIRSMPISPEIEPPTVFVVRKE